ncbi:unnamed protein product, partial [Amoebophrya sp. A25]
KLRNDSVASEQRAMTLERKLETKDVLNTACQIQLPEALDADPFFFKKLENWLGETFDALASILRTFECDTLDDGTCESGE